MHASHLSSMLKYSDLLVVLLLHQMKTVISKAEVLTDTAKQTFFSGIKETESFKQCSLLYTEIVCNDCHCHMLTFPMISRALSCVGRCYAVEFNVIITILYLYIYF